MPRGLTDAEYRRPHESLQRPGPVCDNCPKLAPTRRVSSFLMMLAVELVGSILFGRFVIEFASAGGAHREP